ncbi:molybdenum cofactor biosynthesis protein MoaE [Yimella sp. RIT 621]|uniref:Molybdopterin synthase catalytic subunit 1 n=1 Tax=Yimella lutea TaxID=587872 RepID=A0A542EEX0_9MICO|nr:MULTISPECIES: molybdenum cofactor biosynthesis protein MoaE [Yimella]RYG76067.1 molybdenum cofactor biosynthesis protein MoaE [Yimella sp. RIT 621]TQJ13806.1 molybdopterin synthase subunit MoaE [Yimella lutea]
MNQARVTLTDVRDTPLSVDEVLTAVQDPAAGGIGLFVGVVRDHDNAKDVDGLEYSAHPSAVDGLRRVCEQVLSDEVSKVAAVHRVGSLQVGDLAVVVAVSAPHRGAALDACHRLIDDLKLTVPIWKHQSFADGSDEWVGL